MRGCRLAPLSLASRASLAWLLAATVPAPLTAAVEGFAYTRDVQVAAPGPVRVPLDVPALQHMAPGGADLHLFAPGGGEVPVRVEPWMPASRRREVVVTDVQRGADGWTLLLDTGSEPVPHDGLVFDFDRAATVPAVRLEGSADGKAWHPLAVGDLFRVGRDSGLERISLSYPASSDRYLRLAWPAAAGYPRVSSVEVETASGPSVEFTARRPECDRSRAGTAICRLALPAAGQIVRRLTLELRGKGNAGYRLDEPRESGWRPLARGVWQRGDNETRHRLLDDPEEVAGSFLRLEIHGTEKEAPRLVSYGVELAVLTVAFEAREAGRYTLAYGGVTRGERGERTSGGPGGEATWRAPGPEVAHPPAPLPTSAVRPGARLPKVRFAASWTVAAPAARPGDLVRLEIPDAVYGTARSDLGDLRIEVKGRQVPFVRWSPPDPAAAGSREVSQPAESGEDGDSQVGMSLPVPGLPLTQLEIEGPARPFRREVTVRYVESRRSPRSLSRPTARRQEPAAARDDWDCRPEPPLPCRLLLPLPAGAPELLTVRFHDGDNPPLSDLDLELWRRRDVLLFVWPEEKAVHLLAGAKDLRAPDYDLEALGDVLLARASQPAELDLTGRLAPGETPWWSRWVLPVALILAGTFLLLLLRRILMSA